MIKYTTYSPISAKINYFHGIFAQCIVITISSKLYQLTVIPNDWLVKFGQSPVQGTAVIPNEIKVNGSTPKWKKDPN